MRQNRLIIDRGDAIIMTKLWRTFDLAEKHGKNSLITAKLNFFDKTPNIKITSYHSKLINTIATDIKLT